MPRLRVPSRCAAPCGPTVARPGPDRPGAIPRRSASRWTRRSPRSAAASPAIGAACGCAGRSAGPGTWPPRWPSRSWRSRSSQRLLPLEHAPLVALALPVVGLLVLLVLVVRARPTLGETALAVDAEGGAGDAVASALAFAGVDARPTAGPAAGAATTRRSRSAAASTSATPRPASSAASGATRSSRLRAVDPGLFRPRLARRPALVALIATALVVPALLLPNPQDLVIAQQRADPRGGRAPGRAHRRGRQEPRGARAPTPTTRARSSPRSSASSPSACGRTRATWT